MEKYGFVYIWFDKKHNRYYIGCRWGNENDGYICSSPWMKQGYKHRPFDFKRKILSRIYSNKQDLLEEEYKWLSKIKIEELGKKYYNLHNHHFNHWSANEFSKLTVGQKISASPLRNQRISKTNKGKKVSEKTKQKLREANKKQFSDPKTIKKHSEIAKNLWANPVYREKTTNSHKGKIQSEDQINKRIESTKNRWSITPKKGVLKTEEEKKKIQETVSNLIWITDGKSNKRINKLEQIPFGYKRGRTKLQ